MATPTRTTEGIYRPTGLPPEVDPYAVKQKAELEAKIAANTAKTVPNGGTAGQALVKVNSTNQNTVWATISSSGSGITRTVTSISAPATAGAAAATDYVYLVSGTTTLTLPTAVGNTNLYVIKNTGVATVSVASTSAQTFDGTASPITLPVADTAMGFISDNSNWRLV